LTIAERSDGYQTNELSCPGLPAIREAGPGHRRTVTYPVLLSGTVRSARSS
jgi:hypothetical protein